jgi:hypothetical protein
MTAPLSPELFWGALVATGCAVEAWALRRDRQEWTASRVARKALRCHTRGGRAATLLLIGSGSAWFANHLLHIPAPHEL